MPFVLDPDLTWERPHKRRRITGSLTMARFRQERDSSPEPQDSQHAEPDEVIARRPSQEEPVIRTSDREELIQCIKRGQRPTWVPKPNLEALCAEANAQAEARIGTSSKTLQEDGFTSGTPRPSTPPMSVLGRPPSALHSGDFYEGDNGFDSPFHVPAKLHNRDTHAPSLSSVTPPSWTAHSPFNRFQRTPSDPAGFETSFADIQRRARAPSLGSSLSSSFVMRPPTSPLVNAINNPSLDFSEIESAPQQMSRADRRRTLPSPMSSALQFSPLEYSPIRTPPSLRQENTAPARSHQSRRSLTLFTYQPAPSASTVYPSRQRRLSHTSDNSSRHRTSMVGSFEESIIRGRMSSAPSKPLDFVAKIGVMGKGDCPEKLKTPPHVSVPFPAVFYNYSSSNGPRSIGDDSPSPYVGTIDLQHNLEPPQQRVKRRKRPDSNDPDAIMAELTGSGAPHIGKALATRSDQRDQDTSKSAIGGAYRVPEQGQLQVIVKNPNNTAVKLFLVPYDLSGMKPMTKTFVRQRSFSSGPIMENVLSDKPIEDPLSNKQMLRYLIHLKFCCLGKGKVYLYDGIRIVFANRVPDGKEKLRNEVQVPEPKFSTLVLGSSQPTSRRQSGVENMLPIPSVPLDSTRVDMLDDLVLSSPPPKASLPASQSQLPDLTRDEGRSLQGRKVSGGSSKTSSRPTSPEVHGFSRSSISISQRGSPVPWGSSIEVPRSPSPAVSHDGLLSKKLRELGRQTARTSLEDTGEESQNNR